MRTDHCRAPPYPTPWILYAPTPIPYPLDTLPSDYPTSLCTLPPPKEPGTSDTLPPDALPLDTYLLDTLQPPTTPPIPYPLDTQPPWIPYTLITQPLGYPTAPLIPYPPDNLPPSEGSWCHGYLPPVNRMTDACESITFPCGR